MTDLGFTPCGTLVMVQPLAPPAHVGSIMLPDTVKETHTGEAVVVALGGRVPRDFGARVGDRVYTDRFQGQVVKLKGTSYRLHQPEEILAVVEAA